MYLNMVFIMFNCFLCFFDYIKDKYDFLSLEYVMYVVVFCLLLIKCVMIEWWGLIIWEYYGFMEMGNVINLFLDEWFSYLGLVGKVMLGVMLWVVDEEGEDVLFGQVGEIIGFVICGFDFIYQNVLEKWIFVGKYGFIVFGDLGYFDEDGFFYICD